MNMGSAININVYTIVLIIIIIINENSNANECMHQLINTGKIDKKFDGTKAFEHAYLYLSNGNTNGYDKSILRQYYTELFMAVISIYNDFKLENPMYWCLTHISYFSQIDNDIDNDRKKSLCEIYFDTTRFNIYGDARAALEYAYFETNYNTISQMNEVVRAYYTYMIQTIFPHVCKTRAVGPALYCVYFDSSMTSFLFFIDNYQPEPYAVKRTRYSYNECITLITGIEKIDINFNGVEVFEHAYLKYSSNNTKMKKQVILRQYLNYIYAAATWEYEDRMLQDPMDWCLKNASDIIILKQIDRLKLACKENMGRSGFNSDAKAALQHAYFHLIESRKNVGGLPKEYYKYMIDTFKQYIDPSITLGPKSYCQITASNINIYDNDQSSTTYQSHFSVDQNPPDLSLILGSKMYFQNTSSNNNVALNDHSNNIDQNQIFVDLNKLTTSDSQEPFNYLNFNPTSEATSVVGHDTMALNQFGYSLYHPDKSYTDVIRNDSYYDSNTDLHIPLANTASSSQNNYSATNLHNSNQTGAVRNDQYYDPSTRSHISTLVNMEPGTINNSFIFNQQYSDLHKTDVQNPEQFSYDLNVSFSPPLFTSMLDERKLYDLNYEPSGSD